MAVNFPGPYEIEYSILVGTLTHVIRVNCIATPAPTVGDAFSAINVMTRTGTPAVLQTAVDGLWDVIRQAYNNAVSCTAVTLWRYPVSGSLAKTYVSAGSVTNPAGSSGSATTQAHQFTPSFRTANGGILKMVLLETVFTSNVKQVLVPNVAGSPDQRLAAYILSGSNWALGRDDSWPIAALYGSFGQNEATWRARYRP